MRFDLKSLSRFVVAFIVVAVIGVVIYRIVDRPFWRDFPDSHDAAQIAFLELNARLAAGLEDSARFRDASVNGPAIPIYDPLGEVLFYRVPIYRDTVSIAHIDVARHPVMGRLIMAFSPEAGWNEEVLRDFVLSSRPPGMLETSFDQTRWVSWGYPRLALATLKDGHYTGAWDLHGLYPVGRPDQRIPGRWTFSDSWSTIAQRWDAYDAQPMPIQKAESRDWRRVLERLPAERRLQRYPYVLRYDYQEYLAYLRFVRIEPSSERPAASVVREEDGTSWQGCLGQDQVDWCLPACVQMILRFYGYDRSQETIHAELCNGAVYGCEYWDELDDNGQWPRLDGFLQEVTNGALNARFYDPPKIGDEETWNDEWQMVGEEWIREIDQDRPLMSRFSWVVMDEVEENEAVISENHMRVARGHGFFFRILSWGEDSESSTYENLEFWFFDPLGTECIESWIDRGSPEESLFDENEGRRTQEPLKPHLQVGWAFFTPVDADSL